MFRQFNSSAGANLRDPQVSSGTSSGMSRMDMDLDSDQPLMKDDMPIVKKPQLHGLHLLSGDRLRKMKMAGLVTPSMERKRKSAIAEQHEKEKKDIMDEEKQPSIDTMRDYFIEFVKEENTIQEMARTKKRAKKKR